MTWGKLLKVSKNLLKVQHCNFKPQYVVHSFVLLHPLKSLVSQNSSVAIRMVLATIVEVVWLFISVFLLICSTVALIRRALIKVEVTGLGIDPPPLYLSAFVCVS